MDICGPSFCSHCHEKMPDHTRKAWAEHCKTAHPELAEYAARSDEWDT